MTSRSTQVQGLEVRGKCAPNYLADLLLSRLAGQLDLHFWAIEAATGAPAVPVEFHHCLVVVIVLLATDFEFAAISRQAPPLKAFAMLAALEDWLAADLMTGFVSREHVVHLLLLNSGDGLHDEELLPDVDSRQISEDAEDCKAREVKLNSRLSVIVRIHVMEQALVSKFNY